MKHRVYSISKRLLADTLTPVNIYLKLRDVFAGTILLESSDYHGHENSLSFICCSPVASLCLENERVELEYPNGQQDHIALNAASNVVDIIENYVNSFEVVDRDTTHIHCGFFGYTTYDAVRYFEDVQLEKPASEIPDVLYKFFRYVIVVDHFSNELYLYEHYFEHEKAYTSTLPKLEQIIFSNRFSVYNFEVTESETSNFTDEQFKEVIAKGKQHCFRGDVFQIVLSRKFKCRFRGDEFNVYRSLRSINPSPYLFFFDFGNFKIFGSSPEAQLQVADGTAHIFPIAGTFRRSGNDVEDAALAEKLAEDEKENAEHVMLVDLARNDMSRNADQVKVEVFKEIQFYSHVIHLVSKVSGKLKNDSSVIRMAADTFPAGTLSGAPKHMALTLIDRYEPNARGFYGGAIGCIGLDGSYNHAIMIRTFLSKDNELTYQAGAGIVSKSDEEKELQEVNNKLGALRKAVSAAEKI